MDKIEDIIKKDAVLIKKHIKGLESKYDKFLYIVSEIATLERELVSINSFDLPLLRRDSISKERKLEIENRILLVHAKIKFFKELSDCFMSKNIQALLDK